MSRDASITLAFADGDHVFRLRYGELMQLQEACDAGPGWVFARLLYPTADNKGWRVEDISHVLRLGLIGGGMEPVPALRLVRTYVEERPPMENRQLAIAVLSAGIYGAPDEGTQKKSDPETTTPAESEASGASPRPSEPVQ